MMHRTRLQSGTNSLAWAKGQMTSGMRRCHSGVAPPCSSYRLRVACELNTPGYCWFTCARCVGGVGRWVGGIEEGVGR